eukprot:2049571-Amphidinium_carterae.1
MLGGHCFGGQSKWQSTVALSSGESEFDAIVKAASQGPHTAAACKNLGLQLGAQVVCKTDMSVEIHSDSSSVTRLLWIQEQPPAAGFIKKHFGVIGIRVSHSVDVVQTLEQQRTVRAKQTMARIGGPGEMAAESSAISALESCTTVKQRVAAFNPVCSMVESKIAPWLGEMLKNPTSPMFRELLRRVLLRQ